MNYNNASATFSTISTQQQQQSLFQALKEVLAQQQALYVEKLVPGKINRTAFLEVDGPLVKKKSDIREKISVVVKSLQH